MIKEPWPNHVTIMVRFDDVSRALLWTMGKQWDFSKVWKQVLAALDHYFLVWLKDSVVI